MSKSFFLRFTCLLALVVFLGGGMGDPLLYPNQSDNADELRAEIEAVCAEWRKAMLEDGDLLRVASFYADDGLILGAGGTRVEGREAIDEYWSKIPTAVEWTLTTFFVDGSKNLIVQRGRSDLTMNINGAERTSSVEFTHLWQRQKDGTLRIVVDGYWRGKAMGNGQ